MSEPRSVLIKFWHGLGDAVQATVVLKHLAKYRPDWAVDALSLLGKSSAFRGLCRHSFTRDRDWVDESRYWRVFDLGWFENYNRYPDRPCSKVTNCLHEVFDLNWDASLGRYEIRYTPEDARITADYLASLGCTQRDGRFNAVLIHYQGNTSGERKNLRHEQATAVCEAAIQSGYIPVILDWDRRSPLPDGKRIHCPPFGPGDIWGGFGSGDAARIAALIAQSSLMVGIDSGPGKCASATDTPTIIVWTGHHPLQFHDPAPNTLHLVPDDHAAMPPIQNSPAHLQFFSQHYRFTEYPRQNLVSVLCTEVLKVLRPLTAERSAEPSLLKAHDVWIRSDNFEQDLVIVKDILEQDAYRLSLITGVVMQAQLIVDIGAHIGCFAKLAHRMNPQAKIVCVEACPENLAALHKNVGEFAEVIHAACTYDEGELCLLNAVRPHCESTGGSVVVPIVDQATTLLRQEGYSYWLDRRPIQKITLEEILRNSGAEAIDLLKLDCEGSEYSILGQTQSLERIGFIVGEYHGRDRWNHFRPERFAHWDYGHMLDAGPLGGLFHLRNPARPVATKRVSKPILDIAVPPGIGDAFWCLTKVPALLRREGATKARIAICGGGPPRSLEFLERFPFVESARYCQWSCVESQDTTPSGVFNYAESQPGWHNEFDWLLVANKHLEEGKPLGEWMPDLEIDWNLMDGYWWTGAELRRARELRRRLGRYCAFYLGPLTNNTTAGHNRGPIWTPENWGELAELCRQGGYKPVLLGAEWDRSYFDLIAKHLGDVTDLIGTTTIHEALAICREASFVVSHQSGLGILSAYLGIPTAMWWRPHGDSLFKDKYVTFAEAMASAWAPPGAVDSGRYVPLIYGRETPRAIAEALIKQAQRDVS